MKPFYVSLVKDLLGCYLEFQAESELAVRQHLSSTYYINGVWKLPWCSIYDKEPAPSCMEEPIIIKAQCGKLYEQK